MSWYGLAGNTKEVNYEELYVMYMYICVYACCIRLIDLECLARVST